MNNGILAKGPTIADDIPDWTLYMQLHSCNVDFGASEEAKASFRLRRRTLLKQMHLMGNTKCCACSGFGHRARDCPTNSRLGMLGVVAHEDMKLIAWARGEVENANRDRQCRLQELPTHHKVPISLNRRRYHAVAFDR